ncbi:MAG: helix-turn-helix domain-containing protein, partial [Steroidobacteraceae bacterium]
IAPLRLRRDDVLPLAMQLLTARCRPGEPIPALSAEAAHLLLTYPWPGNVRELDNLLQRALILVNGPVIRPEHIQFELANEVPQPAAAAAAGEASGSLAGSLVQAERDLILDALRNHQGSRREAAERLGISPRTLRYKLARLRQAGVDVPAA